LYLWNGGGYYIYSYEGAGAGTGMGYPSDYIDINGGTPGAAPGDVYDTLDQVYWTQPPANNIAQAYFITAGSPESWVQNVTVP